MSDLLDMVHRASCVDSTMKAWKEKRQAEWERQDANWEKEYDARIIREEREEKEREEFEKERWALLSEEQKKAELDEFEREFCVSDSDSDSDDSDDEDDYTEEEMNNEWFKDYSNLSPEDRKAREWEDYKKESKEWREKRTREIYHTFCYCSWPQLRRYRSQLGLSNENFMADTFIIN
tara:strand:+ start:83 stop:616 length:534 start_codon:yes stop_codon:yes gene_type:complete